MRHLKTVKFLKREYPYLLFLVPAALIYTTITVIPTLYTFVYSFTNYNGLNPAFRFVGFHNYIKIFKVDNVTTSLINSLVYGFITPIVVTAIAIPLALVLNSKLKTRNFQRAVFFFPSVISALFLGYIWNFILSPSSNGLVNRVLALLGKKNALLLADPHMAMFWLIVVTVWSCAGWHSCIYLANLQTISEDFYEAAIIDGAGPFQKFRFITFPMLAPSMTTSVMLLLTGSLKVFDLPFALTNGGPGYSTTMITQTIITEGISSNLVGFASAMSVVFFLFITLFTLLQVNVMRKREENLV